MTPSALLIKAEGSGTTPEVEERTLPLGPKVTNALEAKPVRVAVASAALRLALPSLPLSPQNSVAIFPPCKLPRQSLGRILANRFVALIDWQLAVRNGEGKDHHRRAIDASGFAAVP